jgi:acetyl-CoA C-acetyltransferase
VPCTLAAWQDDEYCRARLGLPGPPGALDRAKLTVNGGSLAAGHPCAATGRRIVASPAKMLAQLDEPPGTARGLMSICAAGGQRVVASLER